MKKNLRTIGIAITIAAAMCQVLFFFIGWSHHNFLSIACFIMVVLGVIIYGVSFRKQNASHKTTLKDS